MMSISMLEHAGGERMITSEHVFGEQTQRVVLSLIELLEESNAERPRSSSVRVIIDGVTRLYGLIRINVRSTDWAVAVSNKKLENDMDRSKTLAVRMVALAALALTPVAVSAANVVAADRSQVAMMDDDKMPMKPGQSSSGNMNMSPSVSQPQNMSGGRMNDDKMKMPGQMQDCQGSGCQQGSHMMQMMQMMERMMRGQMNSSSSQSAASGPADVTERLEGRIAFLKAELQITDQQLADWSNLADALRSSRRHLLEARKLVAIDEKMDGAARLEQYERHLAERLEAIKSARMAFGRLYASLNESQKQTADTILLPLIATF
jgi:hypothetical protein